MLRWFVVYRPLRTLLSRSSFRVILSYAKIMAVLRFLPIVGYLLERAQMVVRGDVPLGQNRLRRKYRSAVLNTFDWYGSHAFQHQLTRDEIRALVYELQPDEAMVSNLRAYCVKPMLPGMAIRVRRVR